MDMPPPTQSGKAPPAINVPEDVKPVYANLVRITHSPTEFVIDFACLLPGMTSSDVQARVLMSPLSLKLFYRALGENLSKFETNFGEITLPGDGKTLAEHLFRPPQK